jgi:hypothetical protein
VTSKELRLELRFVKYKDFLEDVVERRAKPVYKNKRAGYQQAWEIVV